MSLVEKYKAIFEEYKAPLIPTLEEQLSVEYFIIYFLNS